MHTLFPTPTWLTGLLLVSLLFFGSLPLCLAQSPEQTDLIQSIDLKRQRYNKQGMLILGSWAIGNMAWGASQLGSTSGRVRGFHEMNIGWNAVNLAIAGVGYYSATRASDGGSLLLSLQEQHSIEKVLLVNAALDVGYMVGGLYLIERGQRREQPRLQGWGQSVMLQGAFLFSFDLIKYFFHRANTQALYPLLEKVQVGGGQVGFLWEF
ncbi:MAG: DUF6992 family protein [Nitritalea sp.]